MKNSPIISDQIGDLIPVVVRVVRRRFFGVHDDIIHDAVSAAVEKCLRHLSVEVGRNGAEVFEWLRTTAIREVLHEIRRTGRHAGGHAVLDHLAAGNQSDRQVSRRILWEWLVSTLGIKAAETVWLHEIEHCPPRDIARIQNITVSSVKARITRSRRILRGHRRWIC